MDEPGSKADALQVLERFRNAAISQSADAMSDVYAVDAVHEFPFTMPGVPSRLQGREEIINFIVASWNSPIRYERYQTLAVHDTGAPNTIVVEQEVLGTSTAAGSFVLPNIVVLAVRDGQIEHLRDYVNVLAAAEAVGRAVSFS